jgi:glycosyltransferase involved in cell wall biosynthesis
MKKRSVCFICSLGSLDSGMPLCTLELARHFDASDQWNVHVILPQAGEFSRRLSETDVRVKIIPFVRLRSFRQVIYFFRFCISLPHSLVRITKYIRAQRIDIVHFSDFIDCMLYPCARMAGAHAIAHLRLNIKRRFVRTAFRLWSRLWVDRVVCISQSVSCSSGLSGRFSSIVYDPGPDLRIFDPSRQARKNAVHGSRIQVLSIAKFVADKGHDLLVEVAQRVNQVLPNMVSFVIIGDVVPGHEVFFQTVMSVIRRYGLGALIKVQGQAPHEAIPALLGQADIFLHLPRYQEGLGGVVLEAMAMQVPVVAFASGGVSECFTEGIAGFLLPQFDIGAVVEKIVLLANDAKLRRQLGGQGRRELQQRFSRTRHFQEIEALYREVIGE